MSVNNASNFRYRVGAGSILGLIVLIFLGELIQPVDHAMTNAEQLRAAAAHPGALRVSSLILVLAATLAPVAIWTLVHAVRDRGAILANIGGVLGMMGAAGLAIIGLHQLFVLGLTNEAMPQATAALAHLDQEAAPIVLPFIFALPAALLLLAVALERGGLVAKWLLAVALAYTVTGFLPTFMGSEMVHHALGLLAYSVIALRILHAGDPAGQTGTLGPATNPATWGEHLTGPDYAASRAS